jgi:hypothetical protein
VKRKSSSERIAATIAGIGATAAALSAAQRHQRVGKRSSRSDIGSKNGSQRQYPSSSRRQQESSDDEWEDELPSDVDDESSVDEGLAFGDDDRRLSSRQSRESMGSNSSAGGLGAWGWRWGGKEQKKKKRNSSEFLPSYDADYQTGVPDTGSYAATGAAAKQVYDAGRQDYEPTYLDQSGRPMATSRTPSSSQQPMQYVDPRPVSDANTPTSRYPAMPGAFDSEPMVGRPGAAPLQQPQPITPIKPAFTNQSPKDFNDSREPRPGRLRRAMSSPTNGTFARDAAIIGGAAIATASIIAASGSGRKSKEPANVRFGFTEEQERRHDREQRDESEKLAAAAAADEKRRAEATRALKEEAERRARESRQEDVRRVREEENRKAAEARLAKDRAMQQEDAERQVQAAQRREQEEQERRADEERRLAEQERRRRDQEREDAYRQEQARIADQERKRRDQEREVAYRQEQARAADEARQQEQARRRRDAEEAERRAESERIEQSRREAERKADEDRRQREYANDDRSSRATEREEPREKQYSSWGPIAGAVMAGGAGAAMAGAAGAVLAGGAGATLASRASQSRDDDDQKSARQEDAGSSYNEQPRPRSIRSGPSYASTGHETVEYTPDMTRATAPILDDDLFNPDYFKEREERAQREDHERRVAALAQKVADSIAAERDAAYADKRSNKDIMAESVKEIIAQASDYKTVPVDPQADNEIQVYNAYDLDDYGRGAPRAGSRYDAVPKLNLISPTPPPGALRSPLQRAWTSPTSAKAAEEEGSDDSNSRKSERSRSITWGADQTHVYDIQTPEHDAHHDRDSYINSPEVRAATVGNGRVTTAEPKPRDASDRKSYDDQPTSTPSESARENRNQPEKKKKSSGFGFGFADIAANALRNQYSAPYAESVSDFSTLDQDASKNAGPVGPLGRPNASTPEKDMHIPGGFDDDVYEDAPTSQEPQVESKPQAETVAKSIETSGPAAVNTEAEESPYDAPLSKKEKKKREKAAKRASIIEAEKETSPPLPEPTPVVEQAPEPVQEEKETIEEDEPVLSKKDKKKRAKAAKRASMDVKDSLPEDLPSTSRDDDERKDKSILAEEKRSASPIAEAREVARESALEDEKRSSDKSRGGFADIAGSVMTAGGVAALAAAATSSSADDSAPASSSKKNKKKNKKKQAAADDDDFFASAGSDPEPVAAPTVPETATREIASTEATGMPGGWDSDRDAQTVDKNDAPAAPVDPFQYQVRDDLPSPSTEADAFAGFSESKKSKKKNKRNSVQFNAPVASSPLRSEIAMDDYIGEQKSSAAEDSTADDRARSDDRKFNGAASEPERELPAERTPDRKESARDELRRRDAEEKDSPGRVSDSSSKRRGSIDDARSAVSAPVLDSERSRRSTSRRGELGAADDDYYDEPTYAYETRSVAASEPADVYESSRRSKRRSRLDDDDAMSVMSSRSRREREESPSAKKEKRGGIFGLFSRKDTSKEEAPSKSSKSTRDDDDDESRPRRRKKHRDSEAYADDDDDTRSVKSYKSRAYDDDDDDDTRSVKSSSRRRHRSTRDNEDDDNDDTRSVKSESRRRHRSTRENGDDDVDSRERRRRSLIKDDDRDAPSRAGSEGAERHHRRRKTDDYDYDAKDGEKRHHHRRRTDEVSYNAKDSQDQSFLGNRVGGNKPPLPVDDPVKSTVASPEDREIRQEKETGDGLPIFAAVGAGSVIPTVIDRLIKADKKDVEPTAAESSSAASVPETAPGDSSTLTKAQAKRLSRSSLPDELRQQQLAPSSPTPATPVSATLAHDGSSTTRSSQTSSRPTSTTAAPLRFTFGSHSPATPPTHHHRESSLSTIAQHSSGPSTPSSPLPPTTTPKGRGRANSEFRPLYLVERNRQSHEILPSTLPSLPSSVPSSRASSVRGSEDEYLSALEDFSPTPEQVERFPARERRALTINTEGLHVPTAADEDEGEGDLTPRASEFNQTLIPNAETLQSEPVTATVAKPDEANAAAPSKTKQQPQFYTWEDMIREEQMHEDDLHKQQAAAVSTLAPSPIKETPRSEQFRDVDTAPAVPQETQAEERPPSPSPLTASIVDASRSVSNTALAVAAGAASVAGAAALAAERRIAGDEEGSEKTSDRDVVEKEVLPSDVETPSTPAEVESESAGSATISRKASKKKKKNAKNKAKVEDEPVAEDTESVLQSEEVVPPATPTVEEASETKELSQPTAAEPVVEAAQESSREVPSATEDQAVDVPVVAEASESAETSTASRKAAKKAKKGKKGKSLSMSVEDEPATSEAPAAVDDAEPKAEQVLLPADERSAPSEQFFPSAAAHSYPVYDAPSLPLVEQVKPGSAEAERDLEKTFAPMDIVSADASRSIEPIDAPAEEPAQTLRSQADDSNDKPEATAASNEDAPVTPKLTKKQSKKAKKKQASIDQRDPIVEPVADKSVTESREIPADGPAEIAAAPESSESQQAAPLPTFGVEDYSRLAHASNDPWQSAQADSFSQFMLPRTLSTAEEAPAADQVAESTEAAQDIAPTSKSIDVEEKPETNAEPTKQADEIVTEPTPESQVADEQPPTSSKSKKKDKKNKKRQASIASVPDTPTEETVAPELPAEETNRSVPDAAEVAKKTEPLNENVPVKEIVEEPVEDQSAQVPDQPLEDLSAQVQEKEISSIPQDAEPAPSSASSKKSKKDKKKRKSVSWVDEEPELESTPIEQSEKEIAVEIQQTDVKEPETSDVSAEAVSEDKSAPAGAADDTPAEPQARAIVIPEEIPAASPTVIEQPEPASEQTPAEDSLEDVIHSTSASKKKSKKDKKKQKKQSLTEAELESVTEPKTEATEAVEATTPAAVEPIAEVEASRELAQDVEEPAAPADKVDVQVEEPQVEQSSTKETADKEPETSNLERAAAIQEPLTVTEEPTIQDNATTVPVAQEQQPDADEFTTKKSKKDKKKKKQKSLSLSEAELEPSVQSPIEPSSNQGQSTTPLSVLAEAAPEVENVETPTSKSIVDEAVDREAEVKSLEQAPPSDQVETAETSLTATETPVVADVIPDTTKVDEQPETDDFVTASSRKKGKKDKKKKLSKQIDDLPPVEPETTETVTIVDKALGSDEAPIRTELPAAVESSSADAVTLPGEQIEPAAAINTAEPETLARENEPKTVEPAEASEVSTEAPAAGAPLVPPTTSKLSLLALTPVAVASAAALAVTSAVKSLTGTSEEQEDSSSSSDKKKKGKKGKKGKKSVSEAPEELLVPESSVAAEQVAESIEGKDAVAAPAIASGTEEAQQVPEATERDLQSAQPADTVAPSDVVKDSEEIQSSSVPLSIETKADRGDVLPETATSSEPAADEIPILEEPSTPTTGSSKKKKKNKNKKSSQAEVESDEKAIGADLPAEEEGAQPVEKVEKVLQPELTTATNEDTAPAQEADVDKSLTSIASDKPEVAPSEDSAEPAATVAGIDAEPVAEPIQADKSTETNDKQLSTDDVSRQADVAPEQPADAPTSELDTFAPATSSKKGKKGKKGKQSISEVEEVPEPVQEIETPGTIESKEVKITLVAEPAIEVPAAPVANDPWTMFGATKRGKKGKGAVKKEVPEAVEAPIVEKSVVEEPAAEAPIIEAPVEAPIVEAPVTEVSVVEEPDVVQSITETTPEPAAVIADEKAEQPTEAIAEAQPSTAVNTGDDEWAAISKTKKGKKGKRASRIQADQAVDEPIVEKTAVEQPIVEDTVVEKPAVEEPIAEASTVEKAEEFTAVADDQKVEEFKEPSTEAQEPSPADDGDEWAAFSKPKKGKKGKRVSKNASDQAVEEPVVEKPITEESAVEEPVVEEQSVRDVVAEAIEEPAAIVNDPKVEQPAESSTEAREPASADDGDDWAAFSKSKKGKKGKRASKTVPEQAVEEPIVDEPVVKDVAAEVIAEPAAVVDDQTVKEPAEPFIAVEETKPADEGDDWAAFSKTKNGKKGKRASKIAPEELVEEPIVEKSVEEEPVAKEAITEEPIIEAEPAALTDDQTAEQPAEPSGEAQEAAPADDFDDWASSSKTKKGKKGKRASKIAPEEAVEEATVEKAAVEEPVAKEAITEEPIIEVEPAVVIDDGLAEPSAEAKEAAPADDVDDWASFSKIKKGKKGKRASKIAPEEAVEEHTVAKEAITEEPIAEAEPAVVIDDGPAEAAAEAKEAAPADDGDEWAPIAKTKKGKKGNRASKIASEEVVDDPTIEITSEPVTDVEKAEPAAEIKTPVETQEHTAIDDASDSASFSTSKKSKKNKRASKISSVETAEEPSVERAVEPGIDADNAEQQIDASVEAEQPPNPDEWAAFSSIKKGKKGKRASKLMPGQFAEQPIVESQPARDYDEAAAVDSIPTPIESQETTDADTNDVWASLSSSKKGKKGKKGKKSVEPEVEEPVEAPVTETTSDPAIDETVAGKAIEVPVEVPAAAEDDANDEWASFSNTKKGKKGKKAKKADVQIEAAPLSDPIIETPIEGGAAIETDREDKAREIPITAVASDVKIDEASIVEPTSETKVDETPVVEASSQPPIVESRDVQDDSTSTLNEKLPSTTEADNVSPAIDDVVSQAVPAPVDSQEPIEDNADDIWAPTKSKKGKKSKRKALQEEPAEIEAIAADVADKSAADETTIDPKAISIEKEGLTDAQEPGTAKSEDIWAPAVKSKKGKKGKRVSLAEALLTDEPALAEDPSSVDRTMIGNETRNVEADLDAGKPVSATEEAQIAPASIDTSEPSFAADEPKVTAVNLEVEDLASVAPESEVKLAPEDQSASAPTDDAQADHATSQKEVEIPVEAEEDIWAVPTKTKKGKKGKHGSKVLALDDAETSAVQEPPGSIENLETLEPTSATAKSEISADPAIEEQTAMKSREPIEDAADDPWAVPTKTKKGKKGKKMVQLDEQAPTDTAIEESLPVTLQDDREVDTISETPVEPVKPTEDTDDFWTASVKPKKGKKGKKNAQPAEQVLADIPMDESVLEDDPQDANVTTPLRDLAEPAAAQTEILDRHEVTEPVATHTVEEAEDFWAPTTKTKKGKKGKKVKNVPEQTFDETAPSSGTDPLDGSSEPLPAQVSTRAEGIEDLPAATEKEIDATPSESVPLPAEDSAQADVTGSLPIDDAAPVEIADAPAESPAADTPLIGQDDDFSYMTKSKKKGKKKGKQNSIIAEGAPEDEIASKDDFVPKIADAASPEDKTPVAAFAVAAAAAATVTAAIIADKADPAPEQAEDEWADFSSKSSRKSKKKGKKGSVSTTALPEEVDRGNAELDFIDDYSGSAETRADVSKDIDVPKVTSQDKQDNREDDRGDDWEGAIVTDALERALTPKVEDQSQSLSAAQDTLPEGLVTKDDQVAQDAARAEDPLQDIDFSATVAAGLASTGFDPNLVIDDADFHRRTSPVASTAEMDYGELFPIAVTQRGRGKKNKKSKDISAAATPPNPSESIEKDFPASEFDNAVASTLQSTGFDPSLLEKALAGGSAAVSAADDESEFAFTTSKRKKGKKGKNVELSSENTTAVPDVGSESERVLRVDANSTSNAVTGLGITQLEEAPAMPTIQDTTARSLDTANDNTNEEDANIEVPDEAEDGYRTYKKEKRKAKKQKAAVRLAEIENDESAKSQAEASLARAPSQREIAATIAAPVAAEVEPPALEKSPSPQQGRVQSLFPGLERVKRRTTSSTPPPRDETSRSPTVSRSPLAGIIHTSEVSQSLPVVVPRTPEPRSTSVEREIISPAARSMTRGEKSERHSDKYNDAGKVAAAASMAAAAFTGAASLGASARDRTISPANHPKSQSRDSRQDSRMIEEQSSAPRGRINPDDRASHHSIPSRIATLDTPRASPSMHGESPRSPRTPSPRLPLGSIAEEPHAHKRVKPVTDVGGPEQIKVTKRSKTPQAIHDQERAVSESQASRLRPKSITNLRAVSNPLSTDTLINRLPWPAVDEERETVHLNRSVSGDHSRLNRTNRPSSVLSSHSNASGYPKEDMRSFSRASQRSSTPTLRRINLSGDLRAASQRGGSSVSVTGAGTARASPITIPFEAPPTPPLNDDEDASVVSGAGALRAFGMDDIYVSKSF